MNKSDFIYNWQKNKILLENNHIYNSAHEHSSCGVGLIASLENKESRKVVEMGVQALQCLYHRGAVDADGKTGDGAGIQLSIPREFFKDKIERPGQKPNTFPFLMSLEQKLNIIESIGVDIVYIIDFTYQFSKISAQEFMIKIILPCFNPKIMMIGTNHHFGKNRDGSPSFLKKFGENKNIEIIIIKPVLDNQSQISSSKIRDFLLSGYIRRANYELGTYFTFFGIVVQGSGRGKKLTFQTANVKPIEKNQLLPKKGVYLVRGRNIGLNTFGMCNIGVRPTFGENKLVMEIHFFHDDMLDLYGKRIKIEFLERIRDEKKFPSSKVLIKQLKHDKQICLDLSSKYK